MANEKLGLIVLPNYMDRGVSVNEHLSRKLKTDQNFLIPMEAHRFANGEGKVVIHESVRGKNIFLISDVSNYSCTYSLYGYENHMGPDEHFQDIIRTISAISGKAEKITLIMPLMYSSRQHRRNGRESLDCAMALRYLESLGVDNILTFDMHDPGMMNTIPTGNLDTVFPIFPILDSFIKNEQNAIGRDKMVVIAPDTGAMNRARKYANVLDLELGLFYKRRDATRIVGGRNPVIQYEYIGPDLTGKSLLIIDDMIGSGTTIIDVIEILKKKGATQAYVITTFAFFTEGLDKFDKLHKNGDLARVYATDAAYIRPELSSAKWFYPVKLTKMIADIIYTLNNNEGMSNVIEPIQEIKKLLKKYPDITG